MNSFKQPVIIGVMLFMFGLMPKAFGQYSLSLQTSYIRAFGDDSIELQGTTFSINPAQGFELSALNSYRFKASNIEVVAKLGYREMYFSGKTENSKYKGAFNKIIGGVGVNYLFTDKFNLGAFIEIENNLDFDDFDMGTGHLFRFSASICGNYWVAKSIGISFNLNRAYFPIAPVYLFSNPRNQARIGILFKIV